MAWNGSNGKNTNGTSAAKRHAGGAKKSPSVMRGAFAALAVVALAAGAWWWLSRQTPEPKAPRAPAKKAPREKTKVTPHVHKEKTAPVVEEDLPHSNIPPEQRVMHTNIYGYVINRPPTAVVITNTGVYPFFSFYRSSPRQSRRFLTPIGVAPAQTLERPAGSASPNLPSASLRCIPAPPV